MAHQREATVTRVDCFVWIWRCPLVSPWPGSVTLLVHFSGSGWRVQLPSWMNFQSLDPVSYQVQLDGLAQEVLIGWNRENHMERLSHYRTLSPLYYHFLADVLSFFALSTRFCSHLFHSQCYLWINTYTTRRFSGWFSQNSLPSAQLHLPRWMQLQQECNLWRDSVQKPAEKEALDCQLQELQIQWKEKKEKRKIF